MLKRILMFVVFVLFCLLKTTETKAQNIPSPELGFKASYLIPFENEDDWRTSNINNGFGGNFYARMYISEKFAFKMNIGYLNLSAQQLEWRDENNNLLGTLDGSRKYLTALLGGDFFFGSPENICPFVTLNLGYYREKHDLYDMVSMLPQDIAHATKNLFGVAPGLGLRYPSAPDGKIEFEVLYNFLPNSKFIDGSFKFLSINIGITFNSSFYQ